MSTKRRKPYVPPRIEVIDMECVQLLAVSGGNASVGGWGDGGSLGGGDAEEEALSRRGIWGNLWHDNLSRYRKYNY